MQAPTGEKYYFSFNNWLGPEAALKCEIPASLLDPTAGRRVYKVGNEFVCVLKCWIQASLLGPYGWQAHLQGARVARDSIYVVLHECTTDSFHRRRGVEALFFPPSHTQVVTHLRAVGANANVYIRTAAHTHTQTHTVSQVITHTYLTST